MIGWIKQIKIALRFEPNQEIMKISHNNHPGPLIEVQVSSIKYK